MFRKKILKIAMLMIALMAIITVETKSVFALYGPFQYVTVKNISDHKAEQEHVRYSIEFQPPGYGIKQLVVEFPDGTGIDQISEGDISIYNYSGEYAKSHLFNEKWRDDYLLIR